MARRVCCGLMDLPGFCWAPGSPGFGLLDLLDPAGSPGPLWVPWTWASGSLGSPGSCWAPGFGLLDLRGSSWSSRRILLGSWFLLGSWISWTWISWVLLGSWISLDPAVLLDLLDLTSWISLGPAQGWVEKQLWDPGVALSPIWGGCGVTRATSAPAAPLHCALRPKHEGFLKFFLSL